MTATGDLQPAPHAQCPVCPNAALLASELRCPTCGSDLTVLRRVQELPNALFNDALAALASNEVRRATDLLAAAACFDQTRPAAAAVRDLLTAPDE